MNNIKQHSILFIYCSFFIALFLQTISWPLYLQLFCPSWINLVLAYWTLVIPKTINIGTGFFLGLLIDLILGSTLGIHSLALSVFSYLVISSSQSSQYEPIYQQILIMSLLSLIIKLIVVILDMLTNNILFRVEVLWGSLVDGLLWPYLSFTIKNLEILLIKKNN
ncbi:rod shape-determining protein MreD [Blochmannia endosymbiont of Colobopsis nipponica]|uniref:rod shape-determining protein MreD n=1 Tax=Blochmannia endosymbiont of Colobopsis nipponica TaxID=2681987 RepID=UPI001784E572|nr:rod shape-determining protein MreD [Blochmannia endosymbiont of Colobopsis nipponica]QOI11148.1 rod shape-determining protein MreD [Blochmannia endosymbiont of Colobopsis nipponica]